MKTMAWRMGFAVAAAVLLLGSRGAIAQSLRFGNHREVAIPDYATLRIGPFYSSMSFSQSAGFRYTRSEGVGTDFLIDNKRGRILEDGYEFPLVSQLDFRNYLLITRSMDMDMSVSASYEYYPMKTQENAFNLNMAEEGITGDFSSEFELTDFVKGTAFDRIVYKTDYVDTRGIVDLYGGSLDRYLDNTLGVNLDWLMDQDMNLGLSLSRQDHLPQDELFKDQQVVAYSESLSFEKKVNEFVVAGLSASFGQNQYTASTNDRPDSFSQSYQGYMRVKMSESTMGSFSLGYSVGSTSGGGNSSTNEVDARWGQPDGGEKGTYIGQASLETRLAKNLSHQLMLSRVLRPGFSSAFEVDDSARYSLNWVQKDGGASANLYTGIERVDPQSDFVNVFMDWVSGVNVALPVRIDLPLTDVVTFRAGSTYGARMNGSLPSALAEGPVEPEWNSDYATWVSSIGTSFPFIRKDVTLSFSADHTARMSDLPELEYTRDSVQVTLGYSHQF